MFARRSFIPLALIVVLTMIAAACGDDAATDTSRQTTAGMEDMTDGVEGSEDGEHDHEHGAAEGREWDGPGPAEVQLQVTGDAESGWSVVADVPQFSFTLAEGHVPGQGHGHVLVDGQLITMIFEPNAFIPRLDPGMHEITVSLAANDHVDYVAGGESVAASVMVEVPGDVVEADVVIDVSFMAGKVDVDSSRIDASVDDVVEIVFSSDVAEEIHVHGYDVIGKAVPDRPARLRFVADVPGVWEVELERAGVPLFELSVS